MSLACPTHGPGKVKQGKFGPYCATKMPDGSWCRWKPAQNAQVAPGAPIGTGSEVAAAIRELALAVRALAEKLPESFIKDEF